MKLLVPINSRSIQRIHFKAKASSTRCFSQQLSKDSQKESPTSVPAVVPQAEKVESSLMKLFQHAQSFLEESSGLIELVHLKKGVQEASDKFDGATAQVADRRDRVLEAQKAHEAAHKKHVSLLMRRDEWSGEDAQSFVTITSEEVQTRQALLEAQDALRRAEDHAIQCQHNYMDIMRQRYHEEQMWQDKWRLVGTYGTWSLIGINTLVFLVGQYRAERREIKRLKHMEEVLLRSQQEHAESMAGFQTKVSQDIEGISTIASQNAARGSVEEKETEETETESEEDTTEEESGTESKAQTDEAQVLINVTKDFPDLPDVPVHIPSVAIGALISATCFVLLSLVARR